MNESNTLLHLHAVLYAYLHYDPTCCYLITIINSPLPMYKFCLLSHFSPSPNSVQGDWRHHRERIVNPADAYTRLAERPEESSTIII